MSISVPPTFACGFPDQAPPPADRRQVAADLWRQCPRLRLARPLPRLCRHVQPASARRSGARVKVPRTSP